MVYPVFDLRAIIKQTPFVVVGGVATRLYMPERMTIDIDILVLSEDWAALDHELKQAGCRHQGALTIGGSTWVLPDGTLLDVIVSTEEWAREAIRNPRTDASGLPFIALPYLIIMKLQASRVQDLADITRMVGAADEVTLKEVQAVARTYAPDALEDIESMIVLGRMELG